MQNFDSVQFPHGLKMCSKYILHYDLKTFNMSFDKCVNIVNIFCFKWNMSLA